MMKGALRGKAGSMARRLRREFRALECALAHRRTPWYARLCIAGVLLYALSPVDLIPDFIPVLGYLDDLIVLPMGVWIAWKLIPPQVRAECRGTRG